MASYHDTDIEVAAFVNKQLGLLEEEYQEELEEAERLRDTSNISQLEMNGLAVRHLLVHSCSTAHGKYVVEFMRENVHKKRIQQLQLSAGDLVHTLAVVDMKRIMLSTGVLMCINDTTVTVSFTLTSEISSKFEENSDFAVIKTASFITYKRMKIALKNISLLKNRSCQKLVELLFGNASLDVIPIDPKLCDPKGVLKFVNGDLHHVQKCAVEFALKQKDIAIIHGPPGTGKTTTLVEIIVQLIKLGSRILVCAPSNIAVDNLLEKLHKFQVKVVRLGHPARMLNSIKLYSLDAAVSSGSSAQVLRDVKEELQQCERRLERAGDDKVKWHLNAELRQLKKELQQRKDVAKKEILLGANVVLATLVTASSDGPLVDVHDDHFDVVIVDECSQALEAACWIAIPRATKLILAGDHLQLPPTVRSQKGMEGGLCESLMERAVKRFGSKGYQLLTHQFRMHKTIMSWVSREMYDGKLEADISVEAHLLCDIPGVEEIEETSTPLFLVNTAGCDMEEEGYDDSGSRCNNGEANIICILVKRIIKSGVPQSSIGVITPYALQVTCIKTKLGDYPAVEVRTVDGFQGREKEAILLSLVRSNKQGELGFVCDRQRLNVAVSRARRFLCVVADCDTVCRDKVIAGLVQHMEECGTMHSAHEFMEEIDNIDNIPKFLVKQQEQTKRQVGAVSKRNTSEKKAKKKQLNQEVVAPAKTLPEEQHDVSYWRSELQTIMTTNDFYKFPPSLSSFERRMVHEAAESLFLQHKSVGEGEQRYILVSRMDNGKSKDEYIPPVSPSFEGKSTEKLKQGEITKKLKKQGGRMKKSKEHFSNEENATIIDSPWMSSKSGGGSSKKSKKHSSVEKNSSVTDTAEVNDQPLVSGRFQDVEDDVKLYPKHASQSPENQRNLKSKKETEPEDFDSMIAAFEKLNSTCSYFKCGKSVKLLGHNCDLCSKMYCFSHALPEIHGCGEAAKRVARYNFQHPAASKTDPQKRKEASDKLKRTLSEMSESRKPKKKEK